MRIYRKESERLRKSLRLAGSRFGRLGVNKKQEIARLIYEISKREGSYPEKIVRELASKDFGNAKNELLKRRFPHSYLHNEISRQYLPKIKLDRASVMGLETRPFYPKKILIEKSALSSGLAQRFRKSFPKAESSEIKSIKDYIKGHKSPTIADYNKRIDTVFITYENHDFFKKCPCTKQAVGCGYHIFNLSFGCIFECVYCYLQEYTNSPGLIFPANIDRFFRTFRSYKKARMRIGTGEFSDSLMLDHITQYSPPIIDFFKRYPETIFEFKTKGVNIKNLLETRHAGNITVAWTFNPQRIIDENEFFTASLEERVEAAKKCAAAGYKIACHFDPVIYFKGWQRDYEKVMGMIFGSIKAKDIAWISIGTLRFNPGVKQIIESRFPGNTLLDQELMLGFDNKLRYPHSIRHGIYASMLNMLRKHSKKVQVYLCMESASLWKELGLRPASFLQ